MSWRWSLPSAAIDQTSLPGSSPLGPRSNASRAPVGDQEGDGVEDGVVGQHGDGAAADVGRRDLDVVAGVVVCIVKASRFPSGESDG